RIELDGGAFARALPSRKSSQDSLTRSLLLATGFIAGWTGLATGRASERVSRRFLQEPCPRVFKLRAPITTPVIVRTPGWVQVVDGPDPERPEHCGELVRSDRPLTAKVGIFPRSMLCQRLAPAL